MPAALLRLLVFALLLAYGAPSNAAPWAFEPARLVATARRQVGVTVSYDPVYRVLSYPGGDVPMETGVCSDVVIRALRGLAIDLQKEVHEDMAVHFSAYPHEWGLSKPDKNIDHRRVPNLRAFFKRRGCELSVSKDAGDYQAGDVVTWNVCGSLPHIGIVSDRKTDGGIPLVIHNIGRGTREEDVLFQYPVTGHYRIAKGE